MAPAPDFSILFAPGGTLALLLSAVAFLTREWRLGRESSVDYYKRRAEVAEGERDEIQTELSERLECVQDELAEVRKEIGRLRQQHATDLREMSVRHSIDLSAERRRTESELRRGFAYREWISAHGGDPDRIDAEWTRTNPKEGA